MSVLIVSGSRAWSNTYELWSHLDVLHRQFGFTELWHGGCRGADVIATQWAISRKVQPREWPADWQQLGKRAGVLRTIEMLDAAPDNCVVATFAAPDLAHSRGTAHAVAESVRRHLATWCVTEQQGGWWICSPEGFRSIA